MKKFLSVLLLAVSVCMLAAGCSIEVEEQQTPDKYSFLLSECSRDNSGEGSIGTKRGISRLYGP